MWSKILLYGVGIILFLAILSAIVLEFNHLESNINVLTAQNAQLTIANKTLGQDLANLKLLQNQINQEVDAALTANNEANKKLQQFELINNQQRQIRTLVVRKAKPDLLIATINKNNECIRLHFSEQGQCTAGIWHPSH